MTQPTSHRRSVSRKVMPGSAGMLAVTLPLAIGFLNAPCLRGQNAPPGADIKFEVASIRPTASVNSNHTSIHTDQARLSTSNTSLLALIRFAYAVQDYQIISAPGWARDERYDLVAKNDAAEERDIPAADLQKLSTRDERIRARLRNLLAERFQLKMREEIRNLPVFALTIDKNGHKLQAKPDGPGNMNVNQSNGNGTLKGEGVTLQRLCITLSGILGKPVIDETGLDGLFAIELKWSADNASADVSAGPSIFTALKEQLGLKLDSKKGPVTAYVIEGAEKPSEN